MTQDNIQTDTPQENNEQPQFSSLEEAVFGGENIVSEGSEDIKGAFTTGTTGNTETAPQGQPVDAIAGNVEQPVGEPSNDEKRYQYWQSQADKLKNENSSLKATVNQTLQRTPSQPTEEPQEEATEQFPPPPVKPQRPRVFNREEAYSDPTSESARYLDEVEDWRDNVNEYNTLKTQYQGAVMEEKFTAMEGERVADAKRQQATQHKNSQARQIKEHVMGHYGMQDKEAVDFMNRMSDPKSLNIDNLVQLYRLQQGGAAQQPQTTPAIPSSDFQQVQNAQQIPSPMGVMPSGQSSVDGRTFEDKIMDNLIGEYDSKNPWK